MPTKSGLKNRFNRFAMRCAEAAGSPWAFGFAILLVAVWASFGPAYQWSSDHSLFINSCTTIVTFLMVFVIQSAQNRDAKIARIERQIILQSISDAPNTFLKLEDESEERIDQVNEGLRQARADADADEI